MNRSFNSLISIRKLALAASIIMIAGSSWAQVTSGSGTNGRIPVWTGTNSQGNSVMIQSAGRIGIGTVAPASPLSVFSSTSAAAILGRDLSNGPGVWGISATGFGVRGDGAVGPGVYGISDTGFGVRGNSNSGTGVAGFSLDAVGVFGRCIDNTGVWGNTANGYGVYGNATNVGFGGYFTSVNNYAGYFESTNSDAADFYGGNWGIYVRNDGAQPAVDAASSGANSYAGEFYSGAYRAGYFKSGNNGLFSLFVDTQDGPTQGTSGLNVRGSIRAEGDLFVLGSKSGYVVDQMQNADTVALQAGDVVVIADDSGAPVLGEIPTPRVKLANSAYDTAVVGVVDKVTYVPDQQTRDTYEAQRKADREAAVRAKANANEPGKKLSSMSNIANRISDEAGTVHADLNATSAATGRYCGVVTLGAYKAVKADATFGAIKAGDLLTTSPHTGHAMKVSDKQAANGAIIGKALSSLKSGVGTVSVLVTLK